MPAERSIFAHRTRWRRPDPGARHDKNFAMLSQVAHRRVILTKERKVFDAQPAKLAPSRDCNIWACNSPPIVS